MVSGETTTLVGGGSRADYLKIRNIKTGFEISKSKSEISKTALEISKSLLKISKMA